MIKKVLLIGGSGFLGMHLSRDLEANKKFTVLCPTHRELDVLKEIEVNRWVEKCDLVINLSGQITHPLSVCAKQNSVGIQNLVKACKKYKKKLIQVSSVLVYGSTTTASEISDLNPESPYAACKAVAEFLVQNNLEQEQYLIIRLANLYGSGQKKGLFWDLIRTIKSGRNLIIKDNDGTLRRNFLHVEDAARLISDLMSVEASGIINLVSSEYYSILELVKLLEQILGKKIQTSFSKNSPQGNVSLISVEKLSQYLDLNYKYSVNSFFQGLFNEK